MEITDEDEREAIRLAHSALEFSEKLERPYVALHIEAFRALLARATRPHD